MIDNTSDAGAWEREMAAAKGVRGKQWGVEKNVIPDMVNSPPHYTEGGIESIDYIKAKLTPEQFQGFIIGNALKYCSRLGKKGDPREDAAKASWYLAWIAKGDPRK
jgi:hypothetical protein